jgi:hypothetical protein
MVRQQSTPMSGRSTDRVNLKRIGVAIMSMDYYGMKYMSLTNGAKEIVASELRDLQKEIGLFGFTEDQLHECVRYGWESSSLLFDPEHAKMLRSILTKDLEDLPPLITDTSIPEGVRDLAGARLEGRDIDVVFTELVLKSGEEDPEDWADLFMERLDDITAKMSKKLGMKVEAYAGDSESDAPVIFWGFPEGELYDDSPAHKALKKKLKGEAAFSHEWTEYG